MRNHQPSGRTAAVLIGLGGVAVVTVLFSLFGRSLPNTIPALLLLAPVAVTSVIADWRISIPIAIVAALVYALAFIPPIGDMEIGLTEDLFVLITFVVVSILVGALKGPRSREVDGNLIDDRRAVLLRGVSHDLRSPLTTIRAISTDLLDGDAHYDDGTRHLLLERVVDESERLDRIVGNLLSVSRVQAGALIPNLEPESVAQLVDRCASRLNRIGTHTIVIDVSTELPDVSADRVQIDQVLTNLVENCLRYTPPGSVIGIGASAHHGRVEVSVCDNGPGFSADALDGLFRPFQRPSGRSTGLGLAVCRAIVEAHGGTIVVRDAPTGGARVSFTLRVADADDAHPRRRG